MVVLNPVPLPLEYVLTALVTGRVITVKCVSLCTILILMGLTASHVTVMVETVTSTVPATHVMLDTGVTCVTNVPMDTMYVFNFGIIILLSRTLSLSE